MLNEKIFEKYGFDFYCINQTITVPNDVIKYWKIKRNKSFIYNYKITINGFDTISKLNILLTELDDISNSNIKIKFFDSTKNKEVLNEQVKLSINNNLINIDLESKHLITVGKISHLILTFENDIDQEPIKSNIVLLTKLYMWDNKSRYKFNTHPNYFIDPVINL